MPEVDKASESWTHKDPIDFVSTSGRFRNQWVDYEPTKLSKRDSGLYGCSGDEGALDCSLARVKYVWRPSQGSTCAALGNYDIHTAPPLAGQLSSVPQANPHNSVCLYDQSDIKLRSLPTVALS